jgi:serine/threonine protein kinase
VDAAVSNGFMTKVSQDNSLDIDLVRAALDADYEILEELGHGGMAVVYRARERALDREVAIKVLPSFMSMDTDFVERFQHEARTAGHLEHPGIVPIYRVGNQGRVIYFVMKLLRGQSVATVLRERYRLGVPEIRRILIETASALGYAAKRGVVHRDIKPDNILLDDEGRCVLTDFGIAKSSGGPNTAAGTSMGTPRYMSPEHARGITLDGRSDMYSLGVVAYQCLAGATPFDADDPFAVLYKHINDPIPVPLLETDEERELYAIIEKMLAKQPQDRYQTADELIEALGGTASSSAPTLVSTLIRASTPPRPARASGLSATEIIETPTLRTRLRNLSHDRRVWAGAGALMLFLAMTFISRPGIGKTDSAAGVPAPRGAAGATTKAVGATTSVAGTSTGARADSSRLASGTKTGANTSAKAAAATKTTPTKTANRNDTGRPAASSLARVGSPVAVRSSRDASRCPATIPPGTLAILADSIPLQERNAKLTVAYDVCGLTQGASFTTTLTFRKQNQRGFRKQQDRTLHFANVASGPRLRMTHPVDLGGLSPGDYVVDIVILDALERDRGKTMPFRISDK